MNDEERLRLQQEVAVKNPMAVPKISKIVLNVGIKDASSDKKSLDNAISMMSKITGQRPKTTKARKSIASFKLRKGDAIGVMVTLRGKRMYDFFKKLVSVVLPRVRDFHGVLESGFDGHGNYTLGFQEAVVFPEIDPGKVDKMIGLEVTIVTTAKDDEKGKILLGILGMPFRKHSK